MPFIRFFDHPDACLQELTGGKGVNLSRLFQAGFQVPPGFCVTTEAYDSFMALDKLGPRLSGLVQELGYDDPAAMERQTAAIREIIIAARMPGGLVEEIESAYARLGGSANVAVRSSGTAEDLADASFAGQHDTYLDVRGATDIVVAVQRCWASLWTARAANYRQHNKFDHALVKIAVVVQKMVESDVSGVMFTANPLTSATNETVINASWGLGEALVQGIVTPDQIVVQMPAADLLDRILGAKELRIVRDKTAGSGVVTEEVPAAERERFSLDSAEITELAQLGARVQEYYGGFPQDIEWGMENGRLYLLQSRPITGVEFSWDAEAEASYRQIEVADTVWSRAFADSLTTGVVTPLTYSYRYPKFSWFGMRRIWEVLGYADLAEMRTYKYWKGEVYFNVDTEKLFIERLPPQLRPLLLHFIPPVLHQETLDAPFDDAEFLGHLLRWLRVDNLTTPTGFLRTFEEWQNRTDYEGLSYEELRKLGDEEVIGYCRRMIEIESEWDGAIYMPLWITLRFLMSGLSWIVSNWYGGDDAQSVFAKLISGATQRTATQMENDELLSFVTAIRKSPQLREAFDAHQGADFFSHLAGFEEGRKFLARYDQWIAKWGHRGHADRDLYYPRRAEDPDLDYQAFKIMLGTDESSDAGALEQRVGRQREAAFEDMLTALANKPDGKKKIEMFKFVFHLTHDYLLMRDNERARPTDRIMYSVKRGFAEIGRRLHERKLIDQPRDYLFLTELELYQLFRGQVGKMSLLKAKISARARDCDRMLRKQANPPMYLKRNSPVDMDHPPEEGVEGVFRGTPTSGGLTTGIARVIMHHNEMGRVSRGEILVTHSTDPGWNPIFNLISAVVVETGGMLSHSSCLAREYGFPAVHLPHAAKLIPDGAMITVDGDSGTVSLVDVGDREQSAS